MSIYSKEYIRRAVRYSFNTSKMCSHASLTGTINIFKELGISDGPDFYIFGWSKIHVTLKSIDTKNFLMQKKGESRPEERVSSC